jgi:predicted Zn-dependent peptidase
MTDMVFAPTFADVDAEREVVLEEIAMVEDTPHDFVHDLAAEAVFGTHPLGRPVIGSAHVISSVSRRSLRSYHGATYAGANVVLAAAGNVDHERIVTRLASHRPGQATERAGPRRKPLGRTPAPGVLFRAKDTEQYHMCLSGPGLRRDDEQRFAAALLDAILGGSASSRLFQEIREKRGMAYSVYTFGAQFVETGQVGVYVGTREDNLEACLDVVAEQVADIGAGNVAPAELERAKENMKGRLLLSLESTSARMTRLGKALVTGTELLPIDEVVARIEAVTADDVAALARRLFAHERLALAGIGPSQPRFLRAAERFNPALEARAA